MGLIKKTEYFDWKIEKPNAFGVETPRNPFGTP
jgi:hypothetical protein